MSVAARSCWREILHHRAPSRGGVRLPATSCDILQHRLRLSSPDGLRRCLPVRHASEKHYRINAEGVRYIEKLHRIEPPFSGFNLGDVVWCATELRGQFALREFPVNPGC